MEPTIHVVGDLSEAVSALFSFPCATRTVWLHSSTMAHLRERRPARDVVFVLTHLASAILHPQMIGEEEDPRRLRIIHRVDDGPRFLHVSLKIVPAVEAGASDEIWVSTAFPMGRSLTRLGNKPTLWRVVDSMKEGSTLEGGKPRTARRIPETGS